MTAASSLRPPLWRRIIIACCGGAIIGLIVFVTLLTGFHERYLDAYTIAARQLAATDDSSAPIIPFLLADIQRLTRQYEGKSERLYGHDRSTQDALPLLRHGDRNPFSPAAFGNIVQTLLAAGKGHIKMIINGHRDGETLILTIRDRGLYQYLWQDIVGLTIAMAAFSALLAALIMFIWPRPILAPVPVSPLHPSTLKQLKEYLGINQNTAAKGDQNDDRRAAEATSIITRELTQIEAQTAQWRNATTSSRNNNTDDQTILSMAQILSKSINQSTELCRDVLRFAAGETPALEKSWFDLKRKVDDVIAIHDVAHITLSNQLQNPFLIYADASRLQRLLAVLLHLRINVATAAETPPQPLHLRISGKRQRDRVLIMIADEQGNLPAEMSETLKHLFAVPSWQQIDIRMEFAMTAETLAIHDGKIAFQLDPKDSASKGGTVTLNLPQPDSKKSLAQQTGSA